MATWDRQLRLAHFLKSILQRLEAVSSSYHLVLYTTPNVAAKYDRKEHWTTLAEDAHWHFEILPASQPKSKSYSLKEVYYNSVRPELAAEELRSAGARISEKY